MLTWLLERQNEWDLLRFSDIPELSSRLQNLPEIFSQKGYKAKLQTLYEAPTHLFNNPIEDEKIPRKKSLRRHYNYFKRNGSLEFKNLHDTKEILGYLDLFFKQHMERRALTDSPSGFGNKDLQFFFQQLVLELAETDWLVFSVVLFNNEPIAFHFGFHYGDRFIWYKPTFDIKHKKHSPGEVLLKYLFEYAMEIGVSEFDFTIGEAAFKHRFSNLIRYNYQVTLFSQKVPSLLYDLYPKITKIVKRYPALERVARRILNMLKGK